MMDALIETENHGYKFYREKLNSAKFIMAPMVEQSELPWRMLGRKYSTHLCYTPMMHAAVFVRDPTYRMENFSTCKEDRPLIAQFCTDDPDLFIQAGKMIENDCDAIDLNLGCPQNIARRGHYGSFLQDEWELVYNILKKGVENIKVPITTKIRVFESIEKTVEYAKMIESTGVSILAVHGRTREQKGSNTGLASWKHIKAIKDAVKIPVFANGNILCYNDLIESMKHTGCDGVMIAEPNLYNPALFANLNPLSWDMAIEYVNFVEKYPTNFASIRGHLFKIFHKVFEMHTDQREKMGKIKNINCLYELFEEIKSICLEYEKNNPNLSNENGLKYYQCQAYIRPPPVVNVTSEEKPKESELNDAKEVYQVDAEKRVKKVQERLKRKGERIERKLRYLNNHPNISSSGKKSKYINCEKCKNPRGENCSFGLCRKCCKDKVFNEETECKGHGLKFRKKPQNNDSNNLDNENSKTILN